MPAHLRGEVKQASKNSLPPRCQEQQAFDKQFKNNLSRKDIAAPSIRIGFVSCLPFRVPASSPPSMSLTRCPLALARMRVTTRDWEDAWLYFAAAARVCPGWEQEQGGSPMGMCLVRATRCFSCCGFPPSC